MKTIYVIGGGAVGALYSAMLQRAGYRIWMQCRSNFNNVRDHGFQIHSMWGDWQFMPDRVISDTESLGADLDQIDAVVLATKVLNHQTGKDLLEPFSLRQIPLLYLQNGIHIEAPYLAFPRFQLIAGIPFVCVSQFEAGIIDHQDYGLLIIGNFPAGISQETQEFATAFKSVGVPIKISDQIQKDKWEKLLWNAPFNPLSVIESKNTTELLANPEILDRIKRIMQEVLQLAKADDYELDPGLIDKKIQATMKMAPYKPSMALDFEAGRSLETDAILGNAIQFAKQHQIPVPELETMYHILSTL